ncbi:MAG: DUF2156 domain-containing protein [Candidatus Omnitrophica bacterium]|nr:DUF2156 domain-containing protein [Candidatus Omnitrophota bacterium]
MSTDDLLSKRALINTYLQRKPHHLAALSFVNLFLWKDFFSFDFRIIKESLCVFAKNGLGTFLYFPPLASSPNPEAVKTCFRIMNDRNADKTVSRIENIGAGMVHGCAPEKYLSSLRLAEYCYWTEDIAGLVGNKYKSKRAEYNRFVNTYPNCQIRPFEKSMAAECNKLLLDWTKERLSTAQGDLYDFMLEENITVNNVVFENFDLLGMVGRVVLVDGKICAYTFGYQLTKDMFCILLETADLSMKGLPTYIFREFCNDAAVRRYSMVNVMDDMGMPNITATKESFRPMLMVPSYTLRKKARVHSRQTVIYTADDAVYIER